MTEIFHTSKLISSFST